MSSSNYIFMYTCPRMARIMDRLLDYHMLRVPVMIWGSELPEGGVRDSKFNETIENMVPWYIVVHRGNIKLSPRICGTSRQQKCRRV